MKRAAALLLLACAGLAQGAVFRNVYYAGSAASQDVLQSLDVYVPDSPGPHPVVFYLHGGAWRRGDKSDIGFKAASFTGRDFVFVSANYRLAPDAPHPAAVEDAAAALAWVYRHASSYAGDSGRIVLLGDEAGAHLAALVATDARWLRTHGLSPAIVRGVVALDGDAYDVGAVPEQRRAALDLAFGTLPAGRRAASPVTHVDPGAPVPPFLLMHARRDPALRRQAERLADRVRGAGAAVVVLPHDGPAGALGAELGSATDLATEQLYAWLAALDVPRVQRLENVVFATARAVPAGSGAVAGLVAHDGRLFARLDGDARVLVQRDADAGWSVDADFSPRSVALLDRGDDGTLFAALRGADGDAAALRAADGSWRAVELDDGGGAALYGAWHRDRVTGAAAVFVGAARVHRVALDGVAQAHAEEGIDGPVLALVDADGTLYASVGGTDAAGLYARSDGESPRWTRVRAYVDPTRRLQALTAVPDPLGRGHRVLLGTDAAGRVVRVDPLSGYDTTEELDLDTAFASLWGATGPVRIASARFVPVEHPENGEQVWVAGLDARHPDATAAPFDGAYYLVRQRDASYAYGVARAAHGSVRLGDAVRTIAPSPFVASAGRELVFGGGSATRPALLAATFHRAAPRLGFWWDRARAGHGLALFPVGARWALVLYTYDGDGEPTWYFAEGELRDGRFVADARGLARYTYDAQRTPPQQVDTGTSGTLAMRFGVAPDAVACAAAPRDGARALATLDVVLGGATSSFCLEPFVFGAPGLPDVDASGLWFGGETDAGWGLAIAMQGVTGDTTETAVLLYHDEAGAPRWALGAGAAARGAAELELVAFRGACPACAPRPLEPRFAGVLSHELFGACGEVRGTVWFRVQPGSGAAVQPLRRDEAPLEPLSRPGCY